MLKKIISIIMVLILISLPIIVIAATESELNNEKNNLQQNIKDAKNKQNEIGEQIVETKSEIEQINEEIEKKEYEIEQITQELNKLNNEVSSLTKQLNDAEAKYDERYDMLCKRLVAQYKRGSVSYLDLLLSSTNLTELVSNYYIVGKIAELDSELLSDIEEQQRVIEVSKKEVESKQRQVQDKQSQLKVEEIALTNKKGNKNYYISQLNAEEQSLQKEIDNYNSKLKQIDNELLEIARQNAANSGGHVFTGGSIKFPVPNYTRISSYFGYRGSAATGGVGTANHNGYDIAAPHYSDVVAAEGGSVIKVVSGCTHDYPKTFKTRCYCGGGYGNYLMISHGGGLVTLYGHVSSINVSVGQIVGKGQKIASVGSCGWSTGYHLHFSTILNNKYVDPGKYLGS